MRKCQIKDCDRKHFGNGFCSDHNRRNKLYGDPLGGPRAERGAPVAWLIENSRKNHSGCLIWPFGRRDQYGSVTYKGKPMRASRAMCIIAHGPPSSSDHEAAHGCGRPLCVNQRHLRWATAAQNTADKWKHGTMLTGELVGGSKLTESDVLKIRSLSGTITQYEIADKFQVSQSSINNIIHRRTWSHIK